MPRNETSVPIFCCVKSRDKALEMLTKKFPSITVRTNDEFTGETGIRIKAEEKPLREAIHFLKKESGASLIRFVCIN